MNAGILKMTVLAVLALAVLGGSSGCSLLPWSEAARNIENTKRLRVGMTKTEVLDIMGEPVSNETFSTPDVWFYFIETIWMDGLTTEDECMPMVFENGKLAGWGKAFYTHYRVQKKQGGKALELK